MSRCWGPYLGGYIDLNLSEERDPAPSHMRHGGDLIHPIRDCQTLGSSVSSLRTSQT